MSMNASSQDEQRGKRLESFLKKKYPNKSWRSRSSAIGIPDSTVIGWRNGREISGDGLARLHELGCDIYWLLTGNGEAPDILPEAEPKTVAELRERVYFLEDQNRILRAERDYHLMKIGELNYRVQGKSVEPDENHDFYMRNAIIEGGSLLKRRESLTGDGDMEKED